MRHMRHKIMGHTYTENGDTAYTTCGNPFVDLFSTIGAVRYNPQVIDRLFDKCYGLDPLKAYKMMLFARDFRNGGLGEREVFRYLLNKYVALNPSFIAKNLSGIAEVGRFDDLWSLLDSDIKNNVIDFINDQLKKDLKNLNEGKSISLLGKWLPSINCHSTLSISYAKIIAESLGYSEKEYRKTLASLRKTIIENNLRTKNYTFDYEKIPSLAMHKYRAAFARNDKERYSKYIEKVSSAEASLKVGALKPYEIIREIDVDTNEKEESQRLANLKWKKMVDSLDDETFSNTIVVCDGSVSKYFGKYRISRFEVASSLAILFSEKLKGKFHNNFITFSSRPQLVNLGDGDLHSKVKILSGHYDCFNLDILAVYKLIADYEIMNNVSKEDYIKRIIIISNMEFDRGVDNIPTYETLEWLFINNDLEIPEVIYLNVESKSVHFAARLDGNIKLFSGNDENTIDLILKSKDLDFASFVDEVLNRYDKFITL